MHSGGFERLLQAVAHAAFHNSGERFDPPTCHPNTRTAVIDKLMQWILGLGGDNESAVVLWFYGPAGAGKSAIAQKIAEMCDIEKLLLACFFFSRSDPTRCDAKSLMPTIAYQITTNFPETREKVVAAIERDPLIFTRSLEAQVEVLIVDPLRELLNAGYFSAPSSRRLIIIDGLDECNTTDVQCKILVVISLLFRKYRLPLLVLVASRPEQHLTHAFNTSGLLEFRTTLALDNTYQPDHDIRLFLNDSFLQVKESHPMRHYVDPSWPSVDVLDALVEKSSGQFIYASTIVKYVTSIRHKPMDRLDVILGMRPPRNARELPFGELDTLYRHIFSAVEDKELVLLILGFHLIRPDAYMDLESLELFFFLDRGDIEILFYDLNSIVSIDRSFIHILHASLGDFLLDATRSKDFHINVSSVHSTCAHLCFQHNKPCRSLWFSSNKLLLTST